MCFLIILINMNTLYQERLMDHYRFPCNKGKIELSDFVSQQYNPSCGDKVQFYGCVFQNRVTNLSFEGSGCVISLATASLLIEKFIKNSSCEDILSFNAQQLVELVGIPLGIGRLKCALLPLQALQEGVAGYLQTKG